MNTPLNPWPDLDTVRREIQAFLRMTDAVQIMEAPPVLLSLTQIRRNTDDVTLALTAFGQDEYARLTTDPGRAAACVFQHAAFALTAFNEQLDHDPLTAALFAVRWAEERVRPLVNLLTPPVLDTLRQGLPDVGVWLALTRTLAVCTAQEAAQLVAWGMVKGLLLNAVSARGEDGEREDALSAMLSSLEANGGRTLD